MSAPAPKSLQKSAKSRSFKSSKRLSNTAKLQQPQAVPASLKTSEAEEIHPAFVPLIQVRVVESGRMPFVFHEEEPLLEDEILMPLPAHPVTVVVVDRSPLKLTWIEDEIEE